MTTNKITVEIKHVYGHALVYPVCDTAKLLAELANKKTFPKRDIELLKKIGFELNIQSNPFDGVA